MWMSKLGAFLLRKMGRWPQAVRHQLAETVATLAYHLVKKRAQVARINLKKCFPEWSDEQIEQNLKAHFRYFAHGLVDRSLFWFGDLKAFDDNIIKVDEHYLHEAIAKQRPIIILAPHFMGLDVGGLSINFDREMATMYQRQSNLVMDELMREGRGRSGQAHLYSRQDGVRGLVKLLRKNIPLYYLPDMDFGKQDAIFSPFFGVQAATLTALPKLAKLTNALIVPCVTRIDKEALAHGQTLYRAQFYPAWDGYPGEDEAASVREMNAFIEARILEEPSQYLWMHKRFKTRPDGEPSFYQN
jgi:KDO2-lipid IV(A) lauroyltransferase